LSSFRRRFGSVINTRVTSDEFNGIQDKLIKAISEASGQAVSSISLSYDTATQITIYYVIFNTAHRNTLKTTIDGDDFGTALNTKITEQNIQIGGNNFEVGDVAASGYEVISGKSCVSNKLFPMFIKL
jgi:hypothetical protein